MKSRFKIADLFAGIGGVSAGFRDSGRFTPALLIDIDQSAKDAFMFNYPRLKSRFHCKDIAAITATDIVQASGEKPAGIVGCPPCQGLSDVGLRKHVDSRNRLVDHYFRLVASVAPAFFVMENVPRVLSYQRFRKHLRRISRRYNLWTGVLNAANYGVPQTRQRAIIIGYRKDLGVDPTPPVPTHGGSQKVFAYDLQKLISPLESNQGKSVLGVYARLKKFADCRPDDCRAEKVANLAPFVTCQNALSDLPRAGRSEEERSYKSEPNTKYQRSMRRKSETLWNHVRWNHGAKLTARMKQLKPGESPLSKEGRDRHPYFSQAYGRLHARGIARTVTTNFHNPGAGRFWHYSAERTLTIREAARLQSVPDTFRFPESLPRTKQAKLVGNAFPPLLARAIACHISVEIGHLI